MSAAVAARVTPPLRIGLIGGGVVGGGTYEILMGRLGGGSGEAKPPLNRACVVTKLCVRDASKKRDFVIDTSLTEVVTDVQSILQDETIDLVVEVMGGTGLAKTVVEGALRAKKAVVTANKALLAEHLDELHQLAVENKTVLAYEAAVCGGIPIIQTLHSCYTGDFITELMGIANGTTNFMLGKMEEGADYDAVLKEAQDLGFAEADPTADVEGHDVRAKICLLAKLAFGTTVKVDDVPCRGITQITPVDFEYAKLLGCTIKLVGVAKRLPKDGELPFCVYTVQTACLKTHASSIHSPLHASFLFQANLMDLSPSMLHPTLSPPLTCWLAPVAAAMLLRSHPLTWERAPTPVLVPAVSPPPIPLSLTLFGWPISKRSLIHFQHRANWILT